MNTSPARVHCNCSASYLRCHLPAHGAVPESFSRLIRLKQQHGEKVDLSSIFRTMKARVLIATRSTSAGDGDSNAPYATVHDDESIHTIGGANDLAMGLSCMLAFGAGPDVPQVIETVTGDEGELRYVVGGSQGFVSTFEPTTCSRVRCAAVQQLKDGIRCVLCVPKLGLVVAGINGPLCVLDLDTLRVTFEFAQVHTAGM